MNETVSEIKRIHNLHLEKNQKLTMSGVLAVPVFNDKTMTVTLSERTLTVVGEDLKIQALELETGSLSITGRVSALRYGERRAHFVATKRLLSKIRK